MKTIIDIIGVIGVLYWLLTLFILIGKPILRDRCIINGFTKYVFLLVVLTPFAMEFIVSNCCGMVSPRELVYTPDLYRAPDNQLSDTIRDRQEDPSWLWGIYYLMIDPGNQHMTTSQQGRAVGVIMAILGVFLLNGLLVSTMMSWFDRRKERWLKGEVRYRRLKGHTVIIGSGGTTTGIVRQMLGRKGYILIMTGSDVESFRRALFTALPASGRKKIIIYYGDCCSEGDIGSLCLDSAAEIFVTGEETLDNENSSCHDTAVMRCLQLIASCRIQDRPVICRVMFGNQTTHAAFQLSGISDSVKGRIDFRPFNYHEQWARNIFVQWPGKSNPRSYLPPEGTSGISGSDSAYVHIMIVGMSPMGIALATEGAQNAHYPNFASKGIRSRITFIDPDAYRRMLLFQNRFKGMFSVSRWRFADAASCCTGGWTLPSGTGHLGRNVTDVDWEFISGSPEDKGIQDFLTQSVSNPDARVTVAVCIPDHNQALSCATSLPDIIYRKAVQVLVYQRCGSSVIDSLAADSSHDLLMSNVRPFGMDSECYDDRTVRMSETIADQFASAYSTIYAKLSGRHGNTARSAGVKKAYGKSAAAKWWSNVYNADSVWTKLRSAGYDGTGEVDPDRLLAMTEHYRWNMETLLMRFRPLTADEQAGVLDSTLDKEELKGSEAAHLDICSWERLKEIDPDAVLYDNAMIDILPDIYRFTLKEYGQDS